MGASREEECDAEGGGETDEKRWQDALGWLREQRPERVDSRRRHDRIEVIAHESRVVALPASHSLSGRATLQFSDLRDESFITNPVVEASVPPKRWLAEQARHGLPRRVAAQAASVQEILTLVAACKGVCLVPASVAQHYPRADVAYVEMSDADPAVISLAWPRWSLRPIVGAFIEVTRQLARASAEIP